MNFSSLRSLARSFFVFTVFMVLSFYPLSTKAGFKLCFTEAFQKLAEGNSERTFELISNLKTEVEKSAISIEDIKLKITQIRYEGKNPSGHRFQTEMYDLAVSVAQSVPKKLAQFGDWSVLENRDAAIRYLDEHHGILGNLDAIINDIGKEKIETYNWRYVGQFRKALGSLGSRKDMGYGINALKFLETQISALNAVKIPETESPVVIAHLTAQLEAAKTSVLYRSKISLSILRRNGLNVLRGDGKKRVRPQIQELINFIAKNFPGKEKSEISTNQKWEAKQSNFWHRYRANNRLARLDDVDTLFEVFPKLDENFTKWRMARNPKKNLENREKRMLLDEYIRTHRDTHLKNTEFILFKDQSPVNGDLSRFERHVEKDLRVIFFDSEKGIVTHRDVYIDKIDNLEPELKKIFNKVMADSNQKGTEIGVMSVEFFDGSSEFVVFESDSISSLAGADLVLQSLLSKSKCVGKGCVKSLIYYHTHPQPDNVNAYMIPVFSEGDIKVDNILAAILDSKFPDATIETGTIPVPNNQGILLMHLNGP